MQNIDITITFMQTIATLYAFFFAVYALGIKKYANNDLYHSYFHAISLTVIIALFYYALLLFVFSQNENFMLVYTDTSIFKSLLEYAESINLNYFNAVYSVFIFVIALMFIYANILLGFYKKSKNNSQQKNHNYFQKGKLKDIFKLTLDLLKEFLFTLGMHGNLILIIMLSFLVLQFPKISFFEFIIFIPLFYLSICITIVLVVIFIYSILLVKRRVISLLGSVKKFE